MANVLANQSVTNALGYASTLANVLGLNNWQLSDGSYNGVKFHLVTSGILANLNQYNPLAGTISQVSGFLSRANLIGGIVPATNDNLPFGTSTVSKDITDQGTKKYARHRIPNSQFNVLEDMGWDGETIRCIGIMFGSSSLDANNNLFNVMINPSSVLPLNRNVLIHPVLGKIQNVLLISYKRIHSSEYYKAISYEFIFETSSPVQAVTAPLSTLSQLSGAFNAIVGAYGAINASIQLATTLFTSGKNIVSSAFQTNYNNAVLNSATLIGVSQLMYTNLKPASFVSPPLTAITPSPVNLSIGSTSIPVTTATQSSTQMTVTPTTNVVNVNLSAYNTVFNTGLINGVTQVISLYAQNVQNTITTIVNSGQQSSFQSVIANFEAAIVALNAVGQALISNILDNTTTIIIQNTITLEELFFMYNINYNIVNNIKQVISLNPGVFSSVNYLVQGIKVVLPNDLPR
jgi:hypothetical protein